MNEPAPAVRPVRRVVTAMTEQGRSTIASDGAPGRTVSWSDDARPGLSLLWGNDGAPPPDARHHDATETITTFFPTGTGGSRFLIERFDPGYGVDAALSVAMRDALAGSGLEINMTKDAAGGFHATATIDYAIVLSGRIELITDEATATLRAGDVAIQTGVAHAWRNAFADPCEIAFVMVASASPDVS